MSSNVNASKNSYEYYAMMAGVISPFLEYHPILPLKENELKGASYYRVMKNENRQLQEIAYFEAGMPSNNVYGENTLT